MPPHDLTALRLLTGDTPTGKLHLGHFVGSLEKRIELQKSFDCYFIIANTHAFINRARDPQQIRQSVMEIALDYLAAGIDPAISTIFVQSEIPAIAELTFLFSMLISHSRLMQNPTLKEELRDKKLGEHYPFGFLLYPVGQAADILAFRPALVPVGEDQLPLIEMSREIARKFNHWYCNVPADVPDSEHIAAGGIFPIPEPLVGRIRRLVGTGPPDAEGRLLKMSKSLDNAIYLSDSPDEIRKKVMQLYTDPQRLRATDPGKVENNPLWIYHDAFHPDKEWVLRAKDLYRKGKIGDVACKKELVDVLIALTDPMRSRRRLLEKDQESLLKVLKEGTARANQIAEATLRSVKRALSQDFAPRSVRFESIDY